MYVASINQTVEGEFVDDKFDGEGTVTYGNGDVYVGHLSKNKKNGQGKYTFKIKQEVHEGAWNMDVKEGQFIEIH